VKRKANPTGQNGAASTYVPARATIVKGVVIVVRECWVKTRRRLLCTRVVWQHTVMMQLSRLVQVRHSADCESVSAAMPGVQSSPYTTSLGLGSVRRAPPAEPARPPLPHLRPGLALRQPRNLIPLDLLKRAHVPAAFHPARPGLHALLRAALTQAPTAARGREVA